jgi:hypothetical protein
MAQFFGGQVNGGSFIVAANISQDGRFVTYESDAAGESKSSRS